MQRRKEIRSELSKNRRILELEKSLLQCNELEKDSSRSLKIIKSYDKLKNQYKNISKSYKKYNKLQNINLSKNNSIISSISIAYLIIADWENRNNDLEKLEKESMQNKNSIQENREKLAELSNSIINMIADECEFCPMCGSLTTDDSRNKIRTYLEEQNPNN